jgi:hypothetical protein
MLFSGVGFGTNLFGQSIRWTRQSALEMNMRTTGGEFLVGGSENFKQIALHSISLGIILIATNNEIRKGAGYVESKN